MIYVNRLNATDLFSYRQLDLKLRDRGLTLVAGPNGVGKTSIFSSLTWTLFGETCKKLRADDVIREDISTHELIKGNTRGYVELEVDGSKIEVFRHRQHKEYGNKLLVYADGRDITRGTDAETQKVVCGLLGHDYQTFSTAVLFPQGGTELVSLTDSALKSLLDRIFQIERFGMAQELVKVENRGLREQILKMVTSLQVHQATEANIQKDLDSATKQQRNWMLQHAAQQQALYRTIEALKASPPQVDQRLAEEVSSNSSIEFNELFQDVLNQHNERQQEVTGLKEQRASVAAELQIVERTLRTQKQFKDEAPAKPTEFEDIDKLANDRAALQNAIAEQKAEVNSTQRDLSYVMDAISKFDDTCPVCNRPLGQQDVDRLVGDNKTKQNELEKKLVGLRQNLKKMEDRLTEIIAVESACVEYADYCAWIQAASQLEELRDTITSFDAAIKDAESDAASAMEQYNLLLEKRSKHEAQLKQLMDQQKAVDEHNRTVTAQEAELERMRNEQCPYNEQIDLINKNSREIGRKIDVSNDAIQLTKRVLAKGEVWEQGFSNQGVKSLYYSHLLPALSERTNAYLEILSEGRCRVEFASQTKISSGELRDKLDCAVTLLDGASEYHKASGGERRRVDLAALMALGDLAASRPSSSVALRLLDEPFDDLDQEGQEHVIQALQELVVPSCGTCLVMTHSNALQALIPNRISIDKQIGVSYLTTS